MLPTPGSATPVYSPQHTWVIFQEHFIALETGFKFLNLPLKLPSSDPHLHLSAAPPGPTQCFHMPNSSQFSGIFFPLPGMSSSPPSASGNHLYTTQFLLLQEAFPVLDWSCKHSLPDHLVLGLPQACLPRPVGFPPRTASQTPCCPVPSPVLNTEDEDVETVPLRQGEPVC